MVPPPSLGHQALPPAMEPRVWNEEDFKELGASKIQKEH